MDAALEQLRHEGFRINPEDEAWLSPLVLDHINLLGRYPFSFPSRSAEVSSGRFEIPEIRWKRPLNHMTPATLPIHVSSSSEFSVPLLPITRNRKVSGQLIEFVASHERV